MVDDMSRHKLWSKLEESLGEKSAGDLMELFRPAYEALVTRRITGEEAPDPVIDLSPSKDRDRHHLWRKLEEQLGVEAAATLIELWDEAGRLKSETAFLAAV